MNQYKETQTSLHRSILALASQKNIDQAKLYTVIEESFAQFIKEQFNYRSVKVEITPFDLFIHVPRKVVKKVNNSFHEVELNSYQQHNVDDIVHTPFSITDLSRQQIYRLSLLIHSQITILNNQIKFRKIQQAIENKEIIYSKITNSTPYNFSFYLEKYDVIAILPLKCSLKLDQYRLGDYCSTVIIDCSLSRDNTSVHVTLSRTHANFVHALLSRECTKIKNGSISITNIARKPGIKTKILVDSDTVTRDCIVPFVLGVKGAHINAVSQQLYGEKIDVILQGKSTSETLYNSFYGIEIYYHLEDDNQIKLLSPDTESKKIIGIRGINLFLIGMLLKKRIRLISIEKEDHLLNSYIKNQLYADVEPKQVVDLAVDTFKNQGLLKSALGLAASNLESAKLETAKCIVQFQQNNENSDEKETEQERIRDY